MKVWIEEPGTGWIVEEKRSSARRLSLQKHQKLAAKLIENRKN